MFKNFLKHILSGMFLPGIGSALTEYDNDHSGRAASDDMWYTKVVKGFNNMFNRNHDWFNYQDWNDKGNALVNKSTGAALTPAENQANAFSSQMAQDQRTWEEQMSNTAYQRGVADMKVAGLNPAMMYGNGASGASTPSGSAATSVSPSSGMSFSDLMALIMLPKQMKQLDASISRSNAETSAIGATVERTKAETSRIEAETEASKNYNKWFLDTYELRKEGLRLANNLSAADERKIWKQIDVMEANIKEIESSTVRNYYAAMLDNASAYRIAQMLPYEIAYTKAQTDLAKSQAALAAVEAAYKHGLIDNGYLDAMCDKAKADAKSAEARAEIDSIKAALRNGTYGEMDKNGKFFHDAIATINNGANDMLSSMILFLDNLNPLNGLIKAAN